MKFLLDTNILIWSAAETLPQEAVPVINGADNVLLFSPASIWEIVIKRGLDRPDFQIDALALYRGLLENGYSEIDITSRHVLAVGELPPIHKDPFDRLLLAQARMENAILLTADTEIAKYKDVPHYENTIRLIKK